MPDKSDIISLNNIAIPTGVTGKINVTSENPTTDPQYQDRSDASSLFLSSPRPPHTLSAVFTFDTYAEQAALLAWLDFPRNRKERSLRVYGGDDASPVAVMTPVTITDVTPPMGRGMEATFRRADVGWKAASATTEGPETFTGSDTHTFTVGGELTTNPLVKIAWSVNRTWSSTLLGWHYVRRITITNNGSMSLYNQVIQLGPWDTTALVSGSKMLSNAADLVPFNEKGERLRRWVVGANTRATFLTFVVDELDAGGSRTYDIAYGNPSATFVDATDGFPYAFPGSPTIDYTGMSGTATAGAVSSLTTGVALDDNRFNSATVILTGAATAIGGQYRRVNNSTTVGVLNVARDFTSAPTISTTYTVISGPFMGDGGQASATTSTTLTDSSQSWYDNEWIGGTVEIVTLTTGIGTVTNTGSISGNTGTQLTVSSWSSGTPSSSAIYRVYKRNSNYIYRVDQTNRDDTNFRGRWRLNAGGLRPSQIWFASDGAPAAWSPTVYNPSNAQNDYNQLRFTGVDVGGGNIDNFAILNASYQKKDNGALKEKGFANGCEISIPFGVLGIWQNFKLKNPDGMCRAVFGCRDRGGEDWELYREDGATLATLTARTTTYSDLTAYGTPYHLLAALTSYGDDDIHKSLTGVANLTDNTILEVRVDARNATVTDIASASEVEVYDLTFYIRRSTQASETAGDDVIRIGQDQKHLFLPDGHTLHIGEIDDVPYAARIYNGSTYVRDVPWPVRTYHIENDRTGDATRYLSTDVLPLTPGSNTIRIQDPDGTMGTVSVELVYSARYL